MMTVQAAITKTLGTFPVRFDERTVAELEARVRRNQLAVVELACFDGLKDDKLAPLFPGTTREQRHQWRCRGIRWVSGRASEELREFINSRKWK